jgi:2'-5' RNA ligase
VRETVDAAAREPRSQVRWVRLDGLHLTVRFLGPTNPERVPVLRQILDATAAEAERFDVRVHGAGAFPSASRPRTLWLALTEGQPELAAIADDLGRRLEAEGWPRDDRPFQAHLTLARADGRREGPLVARILAERAAGLDAASVVDRLVLFESVTGGGPARYVAMHEARLGG